MEENKWKFISISEKLQLKNTYLFLVVLSCCVYFFMTNVTLFLDDVFIYLRVVKNIANGTGPVLNPGDGHFAVTSPLWVFILALFHKVFGFIQLTVLAKILFVITLASASFLAFLSLRRYTGSWAALTPIPFFFNYITSTTVGGEIALVYLSLFGIAWAYFIKRNFLLTGLFAAVAYLARGELILILLPMVLHYLFVSWKEEKSFKEIAVEVSKFSAVFLAVVATWHIYYAIQFQSLFPNTLQTKIVQGKSGWALYHTDALFHAWNIIRSKFLALFFLLFGIFYFRGLTISLSVFALLHYFAYRMLTIPNYHWYYYDIFLFIPIFTLFGIIGFFIFLRKFFQTCEYGSKKPAKFHKTTQLILFPVVVYLVVSCLILTTNIRKTGKYKNDPRHTKYMKFVERIKPVMKKGDVLLAYEIGIIAYYLDDIVIRDVNGIASPDVTVENINDVSYFVRTYRPRFIFFHPLPGLEDLEYIPVNEKTTALYKKDFPGKDSNIRESLYIYVKDIPTGEVPVQEVAARETPVN
ncbi:MAG: glycosyltransferase family 39 protein [bacterium]|nr:glycosyltransferase family 39 protein [bacterium]